MEGMSNACEYAGISNALFNTPQATMPGWLCGVLMEQITSLRNGLIENRLDCRDNALHCRDLMMVVWLHPENS